MTDADRRELHKMEAQWLYEEMADFVRMIQRYWSIYVTAIFVSIGWVLGQLLGESGTVQTFDSLRSRQDVAAVLCVVPLLNVLFVMLMLEANAHMQSLARYRFLLGYLLGEGEPAWRWELWKTTPEGTIRPWTNPSNVLFGVVALLLTIVALWFPWPAVTSTGAPGLLQALWLVALAFPILLVLIVGYIGLRRVSRNNVADPPTDQWHQLWALRKRAEPST